MEAITLIVALLAVVIGAGGGVFVYRMIQNVRLGKTEDLVATMKTEAEKNAKSIIKDADLKAKEIRLQAKQEVQEENKKHKAELSKRERHLFQKEENITKKTDYLDQKEDAIRHREKQMDKKERSLDQKEERIDGLILEQVQKLEQVAGLSAEEAKKRLIDSMLDEAKHDAAKSIKMIEDEAKETAEAKAKKIISLSIQRYAGEYVTERAVSVISLPNDEMKGRIIGREGRNIRALEAATGIDLIVDDTPEAVVLSGFNPVRREIAKMALEALIDDGRIHPARIEEVVEKCEKELDSKIKEFGQQAAFDMGIHGLHGEIGKLLGRLRYRTSYGQNVWQHSIEVGFLCGLMAAELGISVKKARRAGLLHDIGKALTHEVEGSHAVIGANLAKKYGEPADIVHAIMAHHEDEEPNSVLAVLVQAADALSGARPGARREIMESYIQRLNDLENIATDFNGVDKSFAIQAGREIRVIVESNKINDEGSVVLAKDIAKKIEEELTYPGQIKVTVIRETRATGIAN